MTCESNQAKISPPPWIDKEPSDWPAGYRTFWRLMAVGAERRLAAEAAAKQATDKPAA